MERAEQRSTAIKKSRKSPPAVKFRERKKIRKKNLGQIMALGNIVIRGRGRNVVSHCLKFA